MDRPKRQARNWHGMTVILTSAVGVVAVGDGAGFAGANGGTAFIVAVAGVGRIGFG